MSDNTLVYALVGSAGTGKSTHALRIAKKYNIDFVLDDGLLVQVDTNLIVAGTTSKAVEMHNWGDILKYFLFEDSELALKMKLAIDKYTPRKLMILSPDVRNANNIASNLGIPSISEECVLNIQNEVSDKQDIALARANRQRKNHCILGTPAQVMSIVNEINRKMRGEYIIISSSPESSIIKYSIG